MPVGPQLPQPTQAIAIWQSQFQQENFIAGARKCTRGQFQSTNDINDEAAIPERKSHGARKIRMMIHEQRSHFISYRRETRHRRPSDRSTRRATRRISRNRSELEGHASRSVAIGAGEDQLTGSNTPVGEPTTPATRVRFLVASSLLRAAPALARQRRGPEPDSHRG